MKMVKKANSRSEFSFNSNLLNSKRSQSQIIGSVLLILLVLISAMIIMAFVVPFVKNKLSGTECLDVIDKFQIKNNPTYTCYDLSSTNMNVQVHVGDVQNLTKGFQINVEFGGSSKAVSVFPGTTDDVIMYEGSSDIELPGKNEERTYVISGIDSLPDSISVYPILKDDKSCEVSDVLNNVVNCLG